jgi:hypothetical protein
MGIKNYLLKIWLLTSRKLFNTKYALSAGFYVIGSAPKNLRLVIFELSDERFIHIGDSLFFEPIMQYFLLIGIEVKVVPTQKMKEYFKIAGYSRPNNSDMRTADIICSTYWMWSSVNRLSECTKIYFDFSNSNIKNYASEYFINELSKFLNIDIKKNSIIRPYKPNVLFKSVNNSRSNFIIFNNSVESGKFRISNKSGEIIINQVKKLRADNYKIIAIGAYVEDSKNDLKDIIDIDLRGKTSVMDIFSLFNCDNVIGSVSYDTAIAHIAMIYDKTVWIKFRKFRRLYISYLQKNIFPFYKSCNSNVTFL